MKPTISYQESDMQFDDFLNSNGISKDNFYQEEIEEFKGHLRNYISGECGSEPTKIDLNSHYLVVDQQVAGLLLDFFE